jgi:hypothetical protein
MAGSKTDYLETIIQKLILSATAYTAPTVVALALSTAAYTDAATGASMNEVPSANAYARVSQTNNTTNFPVVAANTPTTNAAAFTFPTATGSWGTVLSAYLVDTATYGAGNTLIGSDITSKAVGTGDTVSVAAAGLTYQED